LRVELCFSSVLFEVIGTCLYKKNDELPHIQTARCTKASKCRTGSYASAFERNTRPLVRKLANLIIYSSLARQQNRPLIALFENLHEERGLEYVIIWLIS
jgi:hypothetical protein